MTIATEQTRGDGRLPSKRVGEPPPEQGTKDTSEGVGRNDVAVVVTHLRVIDLFVNLPSRPYGGEPFLHSEGEIGDDNLHAEGIHKRGNGDGAHGHFRKHSGLSARLLRICHRENTFLKGETRGNRAHNSSFGVLVWGRNDCCFTKGRGECKTDSPSVNSCFMSE